MTQTLLTNRRSPDESFEKLSNNFFLRFEVFIHFPNDAHDQQVRWSVLQEERQKKNNKVRHFVVKLAALKALAKQAVSDLRCQLGCTLENPQIESWWLHRRLRY